MNEKDIEPIPLTIDDRIDKLIQTMEKHVSAKQAEDEVWEPTVGNVLAGILGAVTVLLIHFYL